MAKSFIQTYLENPNIRLFNLQDVLEHSKYVQDVVSYHTQDLDVDWLCVFENDGLLINPFKITLYKTEILNVLGGPREKDPHKITLEFNYTDRATVELGKSWTDDVEHTEPVKHRLTLNELDDILTDKTVQRLKSLVFTELGKFYNCETIINQRNEKMIEPNESAEKVKKATDPDHYKGLKRLGVDSVVVLEDFMEMESTLTPTQKFLCATAMKYILRLGRKNSVDEDLQKAENYIHRARTGKWIPREYIL